MKISLFLILVLFYFPSLKAENYFIQLNSKGLTQRQTILEGKTQLNKSQAQLKIRTLGKVDRFNRWLTVQGSQAQLDSFLSDLNKQGLVELIEPVGHFRITGMSDDSLFNQQWYLDKIDIQQAWEISSGEPGIIVGVIDTGVDYTHPDLSAGLWRNGIEEAGTPGVDDDGNGYIDDVVGWDFTDVPRFPDGGDYLDEDNDPMDEFGSGHGTQVAGIIAAQANGVGITGVAPGIRVMALRAGTASGYLEEDDVVRALLYAMDNGARIINMSFGDTALSQLLRDVLFYAHEQGIILITSAGNSASDEVQFPAALVETISVGASTINDYLAGFSSYGANTDLVAPGDSILSTAVGGKYSLVNGTSFSAPMVSAVSGLILSNEPNFTPQQVRNILKSSSDDIMNSGWDMYSGSGRLNGARAVAVTNSGVLEIHTPVPNFSTAADSVIIRGTVLHPDLLRSELAYGIGANPGDWQTIGSWERQQALYDTLGILRLATIPDTLIELRLRMDLINGISDEQHRQFRIDRSAPVIDNVQVKMMFDGPGRAALVAFNSDDFCESELFLRPSGSNEFSIQRTFSYVAQNHVLKLPGDVFSDSYEFYIQAVNNSGLISIDDNDGLFYTFDLTFPQNWTSFTELPWTIPSGFFLDKALDLDSDGKNEVILSRYDSDYAYGPIEIYEFNENQFSKRLQTGFTAIPRDAGDVDNDGKPDMLLGYGQHSFLFESISANSFPEELVWLDTTDFWAAGYTDMDADGKKEMIGRKDNMYIALENVADNQFTEIVAFENLSPGANQYGPPHIQSTDFDGDGRPEIIFGDYDGDLMVYSLNAQNEALLLDTLRTIQQDATTLFTVDSVSIFVASHTTDEAYYEHEVDARYWSLDYFRFDPDQSQFSVQQTLHFSGYKNQKDFDSGIQLARFSGKSYLFASFFPNLYIFEVETDGLTLIWFSPDARSNGILISDFNKDGWQEFYYNNGDQIIGFSEGLLSQPQAPVSFLAEPLDTVHVHLEWAEVSGQPTYWVYRGSEKDSLSFLLETNSTEIIDTVEASNRWYYYAVSVLDSAFTIPMGPLSSVDSAFTAESPRLSGLTVLNERQLQIYFDKYIQLRDDRVAQASLLVKNLETRSLVVMPGEQSLLVTFSDPFNEGLVDTVLISNVFGRFGTPIDPNHHQWTFEYLKEAAFPIVQSSEIVSRTNLKLQFDQPMQRTSILDLENYRLTPTGNVLSVRLLDSSATTIELELSDGALAGGFGQEAYLELIKLRSERGELLEDGTKINLFVAAVDLNKIIVYPQPLRPNHNALIFANVPQNAQISVFNIQGECIWRQNAPVYYGGVQWDLKDTQSRTVASGIYLYEIVFENKRKLGKVVVVR